MATAYAANQLAGASLAPPQVGSVPTQTARLFVGVLVVILYAALVAIVIRYANSKIDEKDTTYRALAYIGAVVDPAVTALVLLFL